MAAPEIKRDSESIRENMEVRSSSKSTHTTASQQLRLRIPTPSELPGSSTLAGPPVVDLHNPFVLHFSVPHPDDLDAMQNPDFGDTKSVGTSKSRGRSSAKDFRRRMKLALANSDVMTRFEEPILRFQSDGMGQMEMSDNEGRVIAFVENGVVTFGDERCKVKDFVRKKVPGNTCVPQTFPICVSLNKVPSGFQ